MKLGDWLQTWRQEASEVPPSSEPTPHELSGITSELVDTLRTIRSALASAHQSPTALDGEAGAPGVDALLRTVEHSGNALQLPPLTHSAGQMRVLLRCIREQTLPWGAEPRQAMLACVDHLLTHLEAGDAIPLESPELTAWNGTYQTIMADVAPSTEPLPRSEPRAEDPTPAAAPEPTAAHTVDRIEIRKAAPPAPEQADMPQPAIPAPEQADVPQPASPTPEQAETPLPAAPARPPRPRQAEPVMAPQVLLLAPLRADELDTEELERLIRAAGARSGADGNGTAP